MKIYKNVLFIFSFVVTSIVHANDCAQLAQVEDSRQELYSQIGLSSSDIQSTLGLFPRDLQGNPSLKSLVAKGLRNQAEYILGKAVLEVYASKEADISANASLDNQKALSRALRDIFSPSNTKNNFASLQTLSNDEKIVLSRFVENYQVNNKRSLIEDYSNHLGSIIGSLDKGGNNRGRDYRGEYGKRTFLNDIAQMRRRQEEFRNRVGNASADQLTENFKTDNLILALLRSIEDKSLEFLKQNVQCLENETGKLNFQKAVCEVGNYLKDLPLNMNDIFKVAGSLNRPRIFVGGLILTCPNRIAREGNKLIMQFPAGEDGNLPGIQNMTALDQWDSRLKITDAQNSRISKLNTVDIRTDRIKNNNVVVEYTYDELPTTISGLELDITSDNGDRGAYLLQDGGNSTAIPRPLRLNNSQDSSQRDCQIDLSELQVAQPTPTPTPDCNNLKDNMVIKDGKIIIDLKENTPEISSLVLKRKEDQEQSKDDSEGSAEDNELVIESASPETTTTAAKTTTAATTTLPPPPAEIACGEEKNCKLSIDEDGKLTINLPEGINGQDYEIQLEGVEEACPLKLAQPQTTTVPTTTLPEDSDESGYADICNEVKSLYLSLFQAEDPFKKEESEDGLSAADLSSSLDDDDDESKDDRLRRRYGLSKLNLDRIIEKANGRNIRLYADRRTPNGSGSRTLLCEKLQDCDVRLQLAFRQAVEQQIPFGIYIEETGSANSELSEADRLSAGLDGDGDADDSNEIIGGEKCALGTGKPQEQGIQLRPPNRLQKIRTRRGFNFGN